jgi:putative transposase
MPEVVDFKDRLYHRIPPWVPGTATFHVRVRSRWLPFAGDSLVNPSLGHALLDSARHYHRQRRWHCFIFLLMPDHLHMLARFPREEGLSRVMHDWKRWHTRQSGVSWQDGYFDHRIRNHREFEFKACYIRLNPVVKKLCAQAEDWPWFCEPAREDA